MTDEDKFDVEYAKSRRRLRMQALIEDGELFGLVAEELAELEQLKAEFKDESA